MRIRRKKFIIQSPNAELFQKSAGLSLTVVRIEQLYRKNESYRNSLIFIENEKRFLGKIKEVLVVNPSINLILFYRDSLPSSELIGFIREGVLESVDMEDREGIEEIISRYSKEGQLIRMNYYQNLIKKFKNIGIVTRSLKMAALFDKIEKVADTDATCMIYGESGTGKELIARAIHYFSKRRQNRFVAVNTGAIPENLLEDELFGHKKGAFTSASSDRQGKFEYADGGSIFLDEISNMPMALQVKLLRVLQERELERVGDNRTLKVDVRVIAASNCDINQLVRDQKFREDLFYRINVIPLTLPSLRERKNDIPLLVGYFTGKYCKLNGMNPKRFTDSTLRYFMKYAWPGNIRELENIVERMLLLNAEKKVLSPGDIPEEIKTDSILSRTRVPYLPESGIPEEGVNLNKILSNLEKSLIYQSLRKTDGNRKRAAELLKINRTTLVEKLKKYRNE